MTYRIIPLEFEKVAQIRTHHCAQVSRHSRICNRKRATVRPTRARLCEQRRAYETTMRCSRWWIDVRLQLPLSRGTPSLSVWPAQRQKHFSPSTPKTSCNILVYAWCPTNYGDDHEPDSPSGQIYRRNFRVKSISTSTMNVSHGVVDSCV
jgi:hypothetical protein